jgi:hypothetical protein
MKTIFFDSSCSDNDKSILDNTDSVFHYTKYEKAIEFILKDRQIKISRFRTTNDPVEYKQRIFGAGYIGDWTQSASEKLLRYKRIINKLFEYNALFISTCMNKYSRGGINRGYDNLRMWSQYGQDHKGICFILSKKDMIEELKQSKDIYGAYHGKVNYNGSDKKQKIFLGATRSSDVEVDEDYFITKYFRKNNRIHFFTKVRDYRDENEYRFVIVSKSPQDRFLKINRALKGVIIGDRFDDVYLPTIKELCSGLPCFSLKWQFGLYSVKKIF